MKLTTARENLEIAIASNNLARNSIDVAATTSETLDAVENNGTEQLGANLGTVVDLLEAAATDSKFTNAAGILTKIKDKEIEWSDSEDDNVKKVDLEDNERSIATAKGDTISLPRFKSFLPQLPEEPVIEQPTSKRYKKRKKFRGLLDEDDSSIESKSVGKKKHGSKGGKSSRSEKDLDKKELERQFGNFSNLVDPWWPSSTSIKRERKALGESNFDGDYEENEIVLGAERQFRANVKIIKERLDNDVKPGVLEKLPHCRIHRMTMKKRKNQSAPELVFCTQVTEVYPNEPMVCCTRCGTWRHVCCGGHYKNYSRREAIDTPFEPKCDRCFAEEPVLDGHSVARKRLDRQRCEQIRRGLTTSAAMRQHSFSKHGGTYKWPLGSVSATHIGGHTRSVHSRHDKAEKQWTDMATKLSRGYGHRPREKVKVRTKELERLLISIEDAEGHTDRHNMIAFLMEDTLKKAPAGFEEKHCNIFDPEDDQDTETVEDVSEKHDETLSILNDKPESSKNSIEATDNEVHEKNHGHSICQRNDCNQTSRFDSIFCSDACGLVVMEKDLLRTIFYCSDIHPSALR